MSENTNQVYQTMLKNEQNRTVFGYSGHVSHGKIDTLPEWQAKDKQATAYINSLENKKFITTVDKAKSNFYLKAGYGLGAEALTGDRAHKIASNSSVQMGLQAKLPFTHETYNTAGDIFDAVTQEKMALDLASYTEAMQDSKVAYSELTPIGGDILSFGNDLNSEIVTLPTPVIASKEDRPKVDISSLASINPADYAEMGSGGPGTAADDQRVHEAAYVAEKWKAALDQGFQNLVDEKSKSSTSKFAHSVAPDFGVTNPMLSNPGTPSGLAAAIDQKNADNLQLIAEAKAAADAKVIQSSMDDEQSTNAKTQKIAEANAAVAAAQAASEQKRKDILAVKNIEADDKFVNPEVITFDARDLDKDGNVSFDEEEQAYLNENKGLNYFEQLGANQEKETGLPPEGAIFVGSDDYIQQLRDEEETKRIEKEAMLKAFRATVTDGTSESMTPEEKARANDEYLKGSNVYAGQDPIQIELIEEAKKERLREIEKQNNAHLVSDEKLIETAKRVKEEKAERFAAAQAEAKANAEKLNAELEQERLEKDVKENAESTPLGQRQNERLDDIKAQEKLKKDVKENAKTTSLGQANQQRVDEAEKQKKSSLAKQLKDKEIELYQNQINNPTADDIAGESSFYNQQRGTGGINRGKFRKLNHGQGSDDPFAFSTLAYPRNLTNLPQIGHYLLFYVNVQNKTGYEYEGVTPTDGDYSVGDIVERQEYQFSTFDSDDNISTVAPTDREYKTSYYYDKGADKGDINYQKRQVQRGGTGNTLRWNQKVLSKGRKALNSMASVHKTTTRITDSVALYMPSASNNTSVAYQDFETGMAGFLALGGKGILDKILNNDYEGAASKFMGMSGTMLVEMLKKVGVEAVSAFTGANGVQQAFDKAFGQTLNPYLEVAFQSMGVRSFSYTFNFTPKNEEESKDVKAIIELFRFHMLPELKGAQHRYLTLPSTFDIHYMYQSSPAVAKENTFLSKIATCVLTKCDVDYTPDGVRSFDSGAPAAQTMTLEFMETEMLTKEKVQQGF